MLPEDRELFMRKIQGILKSSMPWYGKTAALRSVIAGAMIFDRNIRQQFYRRCFLWQDSVIYFRNLCRAH